MRKALVALTALAVLGGVAKAAENGVNIGGVAWIQWSNDFKANQNSFSIKRNYVTVKKYFSSKTYFRTTVDVGYNGAYFSPKLKYAYLNIDVSDMIPNGHLKIGLVDTPMIVWGIKHNWHYLPIEVNFVGDEKTESYIPTTASVSSYGLEPSADFGATLYGKCDLASWGFGIYNGEGYKKEENDVGFGKAVEGRISLFPIKSLALTVFGKYSSESYQKNNKFGDVLLVFNNEMATFGAQYLQGKKDTDYRGYSINAELKGKSFGAPLNVFARYDYFKTDADATLGIPEAKSKKIIYGVSHSFNKDVRLILADKRNYQTVNPDEHTFVLLTEVKW